MAIPPKKNPNPSSQKTGNDSQPAQDRANYHQLAMRKKVGWMRIIGTGSLGLVTFLNHTRSEAGVVNPSKQISSVVVPAEETMHNPSRLVFTDRIRPAENQRTKVFLPPQKIGVLVDVKAGDLSRYQIYVEKTKDGGHIVKAAPISINGQKEIEYTLPDYDPLGVLPINVGKAITGAGLEEWRESYRINGYGDVSTTSKDYPKRHTLKVPNIELDWHNSIILAELPPNLELVIRVDMGTKNSPQMRWIKDMMEKSNHLLMEIDSYLGSSDPLVNFIKDATIDPQTGNFDQNAKATLHSLFSLMPKDRSAFMHAIQIADITRAKQILTFRNANPPITEQIFSALLAYKAACAANDIPLEAAIETLCLTRRSFSYNKMKQETSLNDRAQRLMKEYFTEQQFAQLSTIPLHLFDIIVDYVMNTTQNLAYYALLDHVNNTINGPQDKFNADDTDYYSYDFLPPHTLHAIQNRLNDPDFVGNADNNWFNRNDRSKNMLSILALIEARSAIERDFGKNGQSAEKAFGHLFQVDNGHTYATLRMNGYKDGQPSSPDGLSNNAAFSSSQFDNNVFFRLMDLNTIARAANFGLHDSEGIILQQENPLSVPERAYQYFSADPYNLYITSPRHLMSVVKQFSNDQTRYLEIPQADSLQPQNDSANSTFVLSDSKITEAGIAISDIMKIHTTRDTTIEAEMHLPASGASATAGR